MFVMLKFYYNGELLEFTDDEEDYMYLNEGAEGIVYKYGDDAIKIYKPTCFRSRLNEEQCIRLGTISTKRILMPKGIAYSDDCKTFIGYSTPFIYKFPVTRVMDMKMGDFVSELDVITEDLDILSQNGVLIDDWHADNVLYDGEQLFIGDPGGIVFQYRTDYQQAKRNNMFTLSCFLKGDLFPLARLSKKAKVNAWSVFEDYDMLEQMKDTMNSDETVKKYVKRMTR